MSAAFAPSPWLAWVKAKRTTSQTAMGFSPGRPPRNANTRAWGKPSATATSFAVGGGASAGKAGTGPQTTAAEQRAVGESVACASGLQPIACREILKGVVTDQLVGWEGRQTEVLRSQRAPLSASLQLLDADSEHIANGPFLFGAQAGRRGLMWTWSMPLSSRGQWKDAPNSDPLSICTRSTWEGSLERVWSMNWMAVFWSQRG